MATTLPVATVVAVTGNAFARDSEGKTRPLKAGDVLREGETIVTSAGGHVELAMNDGSRLDIGEKQTVAVSADMDETIRPQAQDAQLAGADIERVIQALNQGGDLDAALEAPAAGLAGGGGGAGNNFVRLLRIAEGVTPVEFEFAALAQDEAPLFMPASVEDSPSVLAVLPTENVTETVTVTLTETITVTETVILPVTGTVTGIVTDTVTGIVTQTVTGTTLTETVTSGTETVTGTALTETVTTGTETVTGTALTETVTSGTQTVTGTTLTETVTSGTQTVTGTTLTETVTSGTQTVTGTALTETVTSGTDTVTGTALTETVTSGTDTVTGTALTETVTSGTDT
ncbi:hypothetical protein CJ010_04130 [Azoarcus sp. DD4]|uniref:retention module-containing protein n=1 Tax=Azoarcus sp. DD4 TaxID=2027405 RepID=UPI0011286905|nr:retention module-containing protein [Azoarcus sp. DD4]QDF95793.1 hypothetical protein CJ010_04130 [Azoarcus sp. DD4]